jgi:teichuronic acid biosynthesis glycosyltransferase TuaH
VSLRFPRLPGRWDDMTVLWGNSAWDGHRLGAQALAEALAEHGPVLYVDPPRSLAAVGRAGVIELRATLRRPRLTLVSPGLARLSPLGPPAQTRTGVRWVTSWWLERAVRRSVGALDGSVNAVISGYELGRPFGYSGERARIFRASDDFSVGRELGVAVRSTARAQRRLAASADAVVCVSPTLVDVWRRRGFDTILVPNGCDSRRLRDARDLPLPPDIVVPPPIVGFTGLLARRIDFELLIAIAEAGHSLLLVGGGRPNLDREHVGDLLDRPNVQWVGHRPYEEIPGYLGAMAVGVLPYVDSAFNRASFPLKLLEYLAAGLPVVSTDLPSVRWLDTDLVRVANGAREFVAAVEVALAATDDEGERHRRLELAATHDWAERADRYLSIIDRLAQSKRTT